MRNIILILSLFFIFLSFTLVSDTEGIILGYKTGNEYLKMDEESRKCWLVGALDGIMAEAVHTKNNNVKQTTWLGRCIEGIDFEQIKAMFEKELRENPEGWHAPAALILWKKMQEFCKERIK